MWDTLVTHFEGTNDVKISKINTLTQEFELFHMLDGESIEDMQQRFIKITNKLHGLGKPITNQDATNKILRCLNRSWQPKITAIKEANDGPLDEVVLRICRYFIDYLFFFFFLITARLHRWSLTVPSQWHYRKSIP
jgi:hypothetical protein